MSKSWRWYIGMSLKDLERKAIEKAMEYFGNKTRSTSSATKDIIRKATVSYLTGTDTSNTTREVSYSSTPRAIKNYTGDAQLLLLQT